MTPRLRTFTFLILAVSLSGAAFFILRQPEFKTSVSGTIECDFVRVGTRYGGRVMRLHSQEGDMVAPGALIAELEAPELEARRVGARAALDEALHGPMP